MVNPFAASLLVALKISASTPLLAKDCGTHGIIREITEEDPIALIQNKLKSMEERGELEQHYKELQKKTKASIERPKPVEGLSKVTETKVFSFDPSYMVKEDLKDHTGKIFAKKGTKINPLETVSLSHPLLFFDGDDVQQKAWAQEKLKEGSLKIILVKGAPLALSEEWQYLVYFDQAGSLAKKLGITHVPALVTQEGMRLRIEEVEVEDANNNVHKNKEGKKTI